VHLDHSRSLEEVAAVLDSGYTSVMFDGSHLRLAENIRLTRQAAEIAHAHGAWIEGELAGTAGAEDASEDVVAAATTDPDAAATFVAATGVDALAVSIGNVHGMSARPVALDLELLGAIAARVPVPLVLHGASGLPDADVDAAIRLGVAKLNVNTELRRVFRAALRETCSDPPAGDDLASVMEPAIAATFAVAVAKIQQYGSVAGSGMDRAAELPGPASTVRPNLPRAL
jgi:ketose-bisphosphate aldolase